MTRLRQGLFLLVIFAATTTAFAQKRPAITVVNDDCDNGVATKAVVSSFRDGTTISQRWSEGNEKVANTPEILIQCWNVDGESFIVTSFGFTTSAGAVFAAPKLYLAQTAELGRQLGLTIFKNWEAFWQEKSSPISAR
jgi:hypothetical protein